MNRTICALPLLFALAACGGGADEPPTDLESAQSDGAAEALARNFEAGDFLDLQLGAKIVGPQGEEVESALANAEGNFADLRSFVACPAGMDPCDPATAPQGTIYTYVHTVRPGVDDPNDPPFMRPVGLDEVEAATVFETVREAYGFSGAIGFDRKQVEEALGPDGTIRVHDDNGTLVWRVVGGNGWSTGEPITFFWQSTEPPAGPDEAYALRADEKIAMASGPFPAEETDEP